MTKLAPGGFVATQFRSPARWNGARPLGRGRRKTAKVAGYDVETKSYKVPSLALKLGLEAWP